VLRLWMLFLVLGASACAQPPSLAERRALADELAARQGWTAQTIDSAPMSVLAYTPSRPTASDTLVVYLEGDGLAWYSATQVSTDPTPSDAVALRMALVHPGPHASAYLARPCQFVRDTRCDERYWTDARFAEEVVQSVSKALDRLLAWNGSRRLVLVGYSGGGAVAALVAARRTDVAALVTVAGNLDVQAWVRHHRLSPLRRSLDPAPLMPALARVPQVHFVGAKDSTVPASLTLTLARRLEGSVPLVVQVLPDFDHACCWAQEWPQLWQRVSAWPPGAAQLPVNPK
jgi:dienelactone hydrolase